MLQSLLTGQMKEKPTYRVWCLYSSFVHGVSLLLSVLMSLYYCINEYALFLGLFIASNQKIYLYLYTCILVKGMVRYGWLSLFALQIFWTWEPLPFCWQPRPSLHGRGKMWEWLSIFLTGWLVYLAGGQRMVKQCLFWVWESSVTVLRNNRVVGFALWISAHNFHSLSSLSIHHLQGIPPLVSTWEWK